MIRCRFCSGANTQSITSSLQELFVCNDCSKEFYSGENLPIFHRNSLVNHF
ncbi:MAG: hypothetical protein WA139_00545 [Candidatus Aenigmatarchaeota archaeon]